MRERSELTDPNDPQKALLGFDCFNCGKPIWVTFDRPLPFAVRCSMCESQYAFRGAWGYV